MTTLVELAVRRMVEPKDTPLMNNSLKKQFHAVIKIRHDNEESLNASRNSILDTLNDCLSMQIV